MRTNILLVITTAMLLGGILDAQADTVKYRVRVVTGENTTRHRVLFCVQGEHGATFTKWTRLRGKHDGKKASDFAYPLPDAGPISRVKFKIDYRGSKLDDWTPATVEIWYPAKRRGGSPGTKSAFSVKAPVTAEPREMQATAITNRPSLAEAGLPAATDGKRRDAKKRKTKKKPAGQKVLDPEKAAMKQAAPHRFWAAFRTSKGAFVIEACRAWAPHGADRFYNLVRNGFYDGTRFFRVVPDFMAQFGLHGDPKVTAKFLEAKIPDDPVKESNLRGTVSYAMAGPATRTTQVFINFRDNSRLDPMGFAPFGRVIWGMETVDKLYQGYGDGPPRGTGPEQVRIQSEGNAYLAASFPKLDTIHLAAILREKPALPKPTAK